MVLEIIIFLLVFAILGFCFYTINKVGLGTLVGPMLYFLVGILLVGVSRAFHLTILSIGRLSAVTSHFWWHIVFDLGMVAFILGILRLNKLIKEPVSYAYRSKDIIIICSLLLASFLAMVIAQPLEGIFAPLFKNSLVEKLGLHHFVAVGFVATAAFYFYSFKSSWKTVFGVGVYPILIFLLLIGTQHYLVLLNNDLKLLGIPLPLFKQIERIVVLAAFAFLNLGFIKVAISIRSRSAKAQMSNQ